MENEQDKCMKKKQKQQKTYRNRKVDVKKTVAAFNIYKRYKEMTYHWRWGGKRWSLLLPRRVGSVWELKRI